MKASRSVILQDGVIVEGLRLLNRQTCIAAVVFCFFFMPPCHAKTINICTDQSGNTVFTDGACPAGYKSQNQDKTTANLIRKDITPPPANAETKELLWKKHQITIEDIEMNWFLTRSTSQQKSILHPQIEFTVHNNGEDSVTGLKIIMIFLDDANKIFGDTSTYLKDIDAGEFSAKTAMYPEMGFIYNGYDEDSITDKKYTVDIYGRYKGDKEKIGTVNFFSKTTK